MKLLYMIQIKTKYEIEIMRQAGKIVSQTLDMVESEIKPGITTKEIDTLVEEFIRSKGAIPAFKDYKGFPASACVSVNDEVVHGIPSNKILFEGDIVSVDIGTIFESFYGDSARTFPVGVISEEKKNLLENTKKSLQSGIDKARKGNRLGQISAAVQQTAESAGYGVVRQLVGHGIGREMHEEPQVPNYGSENDGPELQIGMVLAIEPMINCGTWEVKTMPDGWTIVTADGMPSAHFEHTVAIGENGPDILTLS